MIANRQENHFNIPRPSLVTNLKLNQKTLIHQCQLWMEHNKLFLSLSKSTPNRNTNQLNDKKNSPMPKTLCLSNGYEFNALFVILEWYVVTNSCHWGSTSN
jgi:hypothetical protein